MTTRPVSRLARLAAGLSMVAFAASPAFAQSITVQGNQRVDAETIRSYFAGERLDQAGIDRGVRAMYNSGMFSDVRVQRSGGNIIVRVAENAVVNRVTLSGNSRVKSDQLFPELQTRSRGPYSTAIVNSDVQRILEIYRRIGRSDANVNVSTATAPNGRIDVTFTIVEGAKTGVYSINFEGNRAFGAWRLKNLMQTTESNLLSFLKTSDVYDPDRIAADVDAIRRHYLKNGYIDVRIVSSDAVYSPERRAYIVTIVIDEGEQYRVGTVAVDSRLQNVDERQLRSRVLTTPGSVYNAESVEKTVEGMTIDAARRGTPFIQVRPRGDRDIGNRVVNLGYTADEGARVYIERINISGNTRTRDYVIRRLQQGAYRPGRAPIEGAFILQERADHAGTWLGAGSRRGKCGCGRSAHRSVLGGCRLLDIGWVYRRGLYLGIELPWARPVHSSCRIDRPAFAQHRFLVHGAVFPRLPHVGGHRSLLAL
jgi:outer membrane protein insertion porin family